VPGLVARSRRRGRRPAMDGTTFWGRFAAPLPRRSLARTTGKNPGRSPGDGLAKSPVVGKPRQIESKKDYAVQHSIVFLDRSTVEANLRAADFPHSYKEYAVTSTNEIVDRLRDATIAIINKVPMREATLAKLPKLKLIAVAATGTDVVDKTYCKAHGITVSNIRNYAFNTVPEHVFALAFALRRNLLAYRDDVRGGRWQACDQFCFFDHPIRDMRGSTLGIVGYGAIGKSVGRIAEAFGQRVLAYDIFPQPGLTGFETLLRESDIVTLHLPLTPETKNMIGARELRLMKNDALLINTGRGGLVDEEALADALTNKIIGGAGFDVLTVEPPKQGNILLDLRLPNFIVTPHVAWASREAMQILADQLIDNIDAFAAGKPQNVVEA
jgi:glycerate dehydrogenase